MLELKTNIQKPFSRSRFLRSVITGGAALTILNTSGCKSLFKQASEGVVEGGLEGAETFVENRPELKDKLDKMASDIAEITSEGRLTVEQAKEVTGKAKEILDRNEENIDELLENSARISDNVRRITDVLRGFVDILDSFPSVEDILNIFVYFFHYLIQRIGEEIAEMIAYILFFLFTEILRRHLEELKRKFWWLRWIFDFR